MTCGVRKRTPPTDRKTCHLFNPRSGVAQKKSHFPITSVLQSGSAMMLPT